MFACTKSVLVFCGLPFLFGIFISAIFGNKINFIVYLCTENDDFLIEPYHSPDAEAFNYYNPVLPNSSSLMDFYQTKTDAQNFHFKTDRNKRSINEKCHVCEKSLCSWREVWDEERGRMPRFIKYAVCESRNCIFDIEQSKSKDILRIETHCIVVTTDLRVKIRGVGEKWLKEWPIACTCARRVIAHHSQTLSHSKKKRPRFISNLVGDDRVANYPVMSVPQQQNDLIGVPLKKRLTRRQRHKLAKQERRMRNSETWAHVLKRRRNRP